MAWLTFYPTSEFRQEVNLRPLKSLSPLPGRIRCGPGSGGFRPRLISGRPSGPIFGTEVPPSSAIEFVFGAAPPARMRSYFLGKAEPLQEFLRAVRGIESSSRPFHVCCAVPEEFHSISQHVLF